MTRPRSLLDLPVVGEGATAVDPRLIGALREAQKAWLVDPLDGTTNFPDFGQVSAHRWGQVMSASASRRSAGIGGDPAAG
jgi:hypothetical protein